MHIISCAVTEGIVFEGHAIVTVVEITGDNVTLEITGPDGETERITLECPSSEAQAAIVEEELAATC